MFFKQFTICIQINTRRKWGLQCITDVSHTEFQRQAHSLYITQTGVTALTPIACSRYSATKADFSPLKINYLLGRVQNTQSFSLERLDV